MKTVEEIYGYKSNPKVLEFIDDFLNRCTNSPEERKVLRDTFMNGYCYYFAVILKTAFDRGEVCWVAPHGHIAWVDVNGCPYDIEGVCATEAQYFIPVSYMGWAISDFMHVNNELYHITSEDQLRFIRQYEDDMGLPHADLSYYDLNEDDIVTVK